MKINWYPGHMAKTKRLMQQDIRQIDLICELLDARIPAASSNPDLAALAGQKKRMIVLNRADQADPDKTERWKSYFQRQGLPAVALDSKSGGGYQQLIPQIRQVMADWLARNEQKGLKGRSVRIMACGIPNVGKSSFINRALGRRSAVAEDRPGVTRQKQWFALKGGVELMDTPGMLWPRIDDEQTGLMLAFTGAVNDDILDLEELACELIRALVQAAPGALESRYKIERADPEQPYETLEALARARGFLQARGMCDTERTARALLDEFRSGKLGRITLQDPPEESGR
ncbi:MAG: ribosome biogenesis GTPase YlqF [Clostridiaceae bacterium]|jgi:ribosome biogenesis GTPase A|nr:ribosome biogenesis GTPase YlqF [Clostridiaceae bacterium]